MNCTFIPHECIESISLGHVTLANACILPAILRSVNSSLYYLKIILIALNMLCNSMNFKLEFPSLSIIKDSELFGFSLFVVDTRGTSTSER